MFSIVDSEGKKRPVSIEQVIAADFKKISKTRYFFDWKLEKKFFVYKLFLKGQTDILGLVSLDYFDTEYRVEIRLLASSKENVGGNKSIGGIAGNLFASAARLSITRYGEMAAISLVPKTDLGQHYMDTYGFEQAGRSMFMEGARLLDLLKNYDHD